MKEKNGCNANSGEDGRWSRDWKTLDDASGILKADSVILWIDGGDADVLESVYATLDERLLGFRQPLTSGLISQVFLTGMPLLEKDVKARREHDPAMDEESNLSCRSMIAVPVSTSGRMIGVVSAVRFEKDEKEEDFDLRDLEELLKVAHAVGEEIGNEEGDDVA